MSEAIDDAAQIHLRIRQLSVDAGADGGSGLRDLEASLQAALAQHFAARGARDSLSSRSRFVPRPSLGSVVADAVAARLTRGSTR
jgi:hypothetical protein